MIDVVLLLPKLTSFIALKDPELLAMAASAIRADALSSLFQGVSHRDGQETTTHLSDTTYQPHQQPHGLVPHHATEDANVLKIRQQEVEMAKLQ